MLIFPPLSHLDVIFSTWALPYGVGVTVTQAVNFLPPLHSKHVGLPTRRLSTPEEFLCDVEPTSVTNITETYQQWNPSEYLTPSWKKVATLTCKKWQKPMSIDATQRQVHFSCTHI
jgi:hypothetical protein